MNDIQKKDKKITGKRIEVKEGKKSERSQVMKRKNYTI